MGGGSGPAAEVGQGPAGAGGQAGLAAGIRLGPQGEPAAGGRGGRIRWSEFALESLVRVLGFSTVGFVLLIFGFLLREGLPVFFELPAGALLGRFWYPTFGSFGALPLILGSALVTLLAVLIALPLGVAAAVFVREVAPRWAREVLKPLIEVLAGIPSVVLGFFGMTVVAPLVRQWLGAPTGLTAFTGALVLAYMSLPTIISVADDALDAVPRSYRDAGLAMGATRWQTTWRVVVPAGRSGDHRRLHAGHGAGHRRDHGRDDGDRQRRPPAAGRGGPVQAGAHHDRHHRRRNGGGGPGRGALPRPVRHRHPAVRADLPDQPGRRPGHLPPPAERGLAVSGGRPKGGPR
jgi:ABC-type nitrate/sulfonate/bicarbonate transport system permease component